MVHDSAPKNCTCEGGKGEESNRKTAWKSFAATSLGTNTKQYRFETRSRTHQREIRKLG